MGFTRWWNSRDKLAMIVRRLSNRDVSGQSSCQDVVDVGNFVRHVARLSAMALKQKRRNRAMLRVRETRMLLPLYMVMCVRVIDFSNLEFLRDLNGCWIFLSTFVPRPLHFWNTSVSIIDPSRLSPAIVASVIRLNGYYRPFSFLFLFLVY